MKEVDLLMRELERLARIERYRDTGKESDLNPNIQNRNAVAKKQKKPNTFTEQEVEILITAFEENLYDYQWDWYRAGNQRTRAILKVVKSGQLTTLHVKHLSMHLKLAAIRFSYLHQKLKRIFLKHTFNNLLLNIQGGT